MESETMAGVVEPEDARWWDSERRDSPFSTIADLSDESYCEGCDSLVDYSGGSKYGRCNCEGL